MYNDNYYSYFNLVDEINYGKNSNNARIILTTSAIFNTDLLVKYIIKNNEDFKVLNINNEYVLTDGIILLKLPINKLVCIVDELGNILPKYSIKYDIVDSLIKLIDLRLNNLNFNDDELLNKKVLVK